TISTPILGMLTTVFSVLYFALRVESSTTFLSLLRFPRAGCGDGKAPSKNTLYLSHFRRKTIGSVRATGCLKKDDHIHRETRDHSNSHNGSQKGVISDDLTMTYRQKNRH
nr:probable serine incorporator [Tanacetum cinerariifolium]